VQGTGGIATPLLPGHDRVADMPQAVRGQWEKFPVLPSRYERLFSPYFYRYARYRSTAVAG